MAITWEIKITNVNVVSKRADLTFMRTDDVTQDVETYSFGSVIIGTLEERVALLELVWDEHIQNITKQAAIDEFITNLEQLAKSNLEAREV